MTHRSYILLICFIVISLLAVQTAFAQDPTNELTPQQAQLLYEIQLRLFTISDLEARNILSAQTAQDQRQHYLAETEAITGRLLTREELSKLLQEYTVIVASTESSPNLQDRILGFLGVINFVWVIASVLMVIGAGWLAKLYLVPILKRIPAIVYEVILYAVCFAFIGASPSFDDYVGQFIALPGCLGLMGALAFTTYRHEKALLKFFKAGEGNDARLFYVEALLLFLVWGAAALVNQSYLLGFMAIAALQFSLGAVVLPIFEIVDFREDYFVHRAMFTAFILLLIYVVVKVVDINIGLFEVFSDGAYFLGTHVYFAGLLTVASQFYYRKKSLRRYWILQTLVVISTILALYFGSVWQISELQEITGTYFAIYLVEKYFDILAAKRDFAWAWAILGLGAILYVISLFMSQYPQYFLFA